MYTYKQLTNIDSLLLYCMCTANMATDISTMGVFVILVAIIIKLKNNYLLSILISVS